MAKVLVIEDEAELLDLLCEEIEDLGHEVYRAANGDEGLKAARKVRPDFICSDVNMPKMDGFQLKHALDEAGLATENLRFIFISAQASKADVADGLMLGADYYMTKPIDFELLAKFLGQPAEA